MVEATVSYAGAGDQRPAPDANMTRCQLFGESPFRRDCICSVYGMYSAEIGAGHVLGISAMGPVLDALLHGSCRPAGLQIGAC
jgi:hypothetical protein